MGISSPVPASPTFLCSTTDGFFCCPFFCFSFSSGLAARASLKHLEEQLQELRVDCDSKNEDLESGLKREHTLSELVQSLRAELEEGVCVCLCCVLFFFRVLA